VIDIVLKSGKEKAAQTGHPWIFNGAIAKIHGNAKDGELCTVLTSRGDILGIGYYNSKSAIAVRMLTRGNDLFSIDLLKERMNRAIGFRSFCNSQLTDSYRLINSEGDFLPGLVVDKFNTGLVVQILTAGMEQFRSFIIEFLCNLCKPSFIYERSDTDSRVREGLQEKEGLLFGNLPESVIINENGLKISVDIGGGQKTGYFFDQRENRMVLKQYAKGRVMCDCFSYSGGFTLNALAAGVASVDAVDISKNAVEKLLCNVELNFPQCTTVAGVNADVFKYLRETNNTYDLIVLDPPKFAKHAGEVDRAARGYKDINLVAMKKILSGGILFSFSCSNAVDSKLFRQIVFAAAADSGRTVQVLHVLSAGVDHPVNIAHREGEYLKGLVVRVL
jgi:23S rRNA (cytosine1962-C5)-methyltransferase